MSENNIEEQDIYLSENNSGIKIEETIDVIDVADSESFTVDSLEAFPALGESNQKLKHTLLNDRELPDQHPITAITGLREELNGIEALKVVFSNEKNRADYYIWQDENPLHENRDGLFVSTCQDINQIKICTKNDDIFGVTVNTAAFVGGQDDIVRDDRYGLVATSGIVYVMCELDVNVGDYVISNDFGMAQKTDNNYGYRVIAISNVDGSLYASIVLGQSLNQIHTLVDTTQDLDSRIGAAEINIISAINVANTAYERAQKINNISEDAIKNALEALEKVDNVATEAEKIGESVSSAKQVAEQAKTIAETAVVAAETIRQEAVATANESLANINNLINELEPITTWQDIETGNIGAEYLTTYIKDGLATKVEVQTVENLTDKNKSAIEKNAQSFQTLVSSIDKYSVGEYSQSYGLTKEQAISILTNDMVYIPTKHSSSASHFEIFSDTEEVNEFTPGYYYTWNGVNWIESQSPLVAFFSEEPFPSKILKYWYIDSNTAPEGYEPHALYLYDGVQWVKVNTLDGNIMNRIVSMVRQTAEEVVAEVSNARGNAASLSARIDENESKVSLVANYVVDEEGNSKVNASSIFAEANAEGSSITLNSDRIVMVGDITFLTAADVGESGSTVIHGGRIYTENLSSINADLGEITAGTLTSVNYTANEQGLKIDLNNAVFDSKYFKLTSDGSATIAGWNITDKSLVNTNCLLSVGDDIKRTFAEETYSDWVIGAGDKFGVRKDGTLYCTNANISGTITATAGTIGGCAISAEGTLQISNANITGTIDGGKINGKTLNIADGAKIATWYVDNNSICSTNKAADYGTSTFMSTGTNKAYSIGGSDSISDWVFGANGKFGVTKDGALYANDVYLQGKITATSGSIGLWKTDNEDLIDPGALIGQYVPDISIVNQYIIMTGTSVTHRTVMGPTTTNVSGYWPHIIDAGNNTISDFRFKNSIEELSEQYDTFFDTLVPKRYKYNQGTSDRYHTGFIAQEVVTSLTEAGLDTKQFAAVCLDNAGLESECWRLRRDEFVALNTWQIQKAKKRITELENKVAKLEALIKE